MIADWAAGTLTTAANYYLGSKRRSGWVLNILAQIPFAYINYKLKLYGLMPMQAFLTCHVCEKLFSLAA